MGPTRKGPTRPIPRSAVDLVRVPAQINRSSDYFRAVAYDEELADRIRESIAKQKGVSEKRMFGGLAFLINGNMAAAASGQGGMLLRADPADAETLTADPNVERAVMQGRTMDGWLRVGMEALGTDAALDRWVGVGVAYAKSLPPKK